jgi:uncharacterized protein (TIGR02246 family)
MNAYKPEEVHLLFAQAFAAGNVPALLSLYEPNALLVAQPGQEVTGFAAIGEALKGFLASRPSFDLKLRRVFLSGDLALLFSDWTLTGTAPDGKEVKLQGQTSDVVRRQTDGRWLVVIDNPFGAAGI